MDLLFDSRSYRLCGLSSGHPGDPPTASVEIRRCLSSGIAVAGRCSFLIRERDISDQREPANLKRDRLDLFKRSPGQSDQHASRRERPDDTGSDPAAASGNKRDLTFELPYRSGCPSTHWGSALPFRQAW